MFSARSLVLIPILLLGESISQAEILVSGRVLDENNAAVGGARVAFRVGSSESVQTVTTPTGRFELRLPTGGGYIVNVQHDGYFQLRDHRVEVSDQNNEVTLLLNHVRELFQALNVNDAPPPIDIDKTNSEQRLSGPEVMNVPVQSTHTLRNSIRVMPSVLQDPQGDLHFNGGAENQVLYTLNGFNIGDPLTGRFDTRLSVESVRSLEFSTGRFSPEFGKGSAGALAIQTKTGTDQWRYSGTNFIPGFDIKKGLRLGSWSPRGNLSGPIAKGRIWFSDSLDTEYQQLVIDDLPKGQDEASSLRGSNLIHTQFNITPSNILYSDFLVNYGNESKVGLGVLDPASSTVTRRSRTWFYSLKDQIYLPHGALLEFGFAENRVYQRRIPQGHDYQILTPFGRGGNSFLDATQRSRRDQLLANLFLPSFTLAGTHQVKVGMDLDRLQYDQDFARTGYELFGVDGARLSLTTFAGSGKVHTQNYESSSYIVDAWRVRRNLLLEIGLRQDWDNLVHRASVSPRASFAYSPFASHGTKLSGGYAVIYDASRMDFFSRSRDQYSLTTHFEPDGAVARGPAATIFRDDARGLRPPRSRNWSVGIDQHVAGRLYASVNLLRRRGDRAFTYVNQLNSGIAPPGIAELYGTTVFDGIFNLTDGRNDEYDSAEVALRQNFGGQYEWMASYTRSKATSNAVIDQSIDQILRTSDNYGPLPWDSPNRFLSWGFLPTPLKNYSVAYLFETRSGFPFSVQRDTGQVAGAVNSHRLPMYLNVNLHVERRFHYRSNLLAIRGGFNNITDHANYSVANNVLGSPDFLNYYGSQGRQFVVRLRWLGREKN